MQSAGTKIKKKEKTPLTLMTTSQLPRLLPSQIKYKSNTTTFSLRQPFLKCPEIKIKKGSERYHLANLWEQKVATHRWGMSKSLETMERCSFPNRISEGGVRPQTHIGLHGEKVKSTMGTLQSECKKNPQTQ